MLALKKIQGKKINCWHNTNLTKRNFDVGFFYRLFMSQNFKFSIKTKTKVISEAAGCLSSPGGCQGRPPPGNGGWENIDLPFAFSAAQTASYNYTYTHFQLSTSGFFLCTRLKIVRVHTHAHYWFWAKAGRWEGGNQDKEPKKGGFKQRLGRCKRWRGECART